MASSVCSSNLNAETGCSSAEAPWGTLETHQMHAHGIGRVFAAFFFGKVVADEVEESPGFIACPQDLWCSNELVFWTSCSQSWDQWLFLPGACLCKQEEPLCSPFLLCFLTSVCSARQAHISAVGAESHLSISHRTVWRFRALLLRGLS